MKQKNNHGDNINRDKINRQANLGEQSTYVENQYIQYDGKKIPRRLTVNIPTKAAHRGYWGGPAHEQAQLYRQAL